MSKNKIPDDLHQSAQELLDIQGKRKEKPGKVDENLGNRLEEAFESVWTDKLKPILQNLQETAAGVLKDFTEYEEEFRSYMRVREPDINVELLEDILHDPNSAKTRETKKRVARTAEQKAKILKKYEEAKSIDLGTVYLESEGIKSASQIAKWKEDPEVQKLLET